MANLKQLREKREVPPKELADLMKIRSSSLTVMENKQIENVTVATLRRYAHALGGNITIRFYFDDKIIEYTPEELAVSA